MVTCLRAMPSPDAPPPRAPRRPWWRGPRGLVLLAVAALVATELYLQRAGYGNPRLIQAHATRGYALVPEQSIEAAHHTREHINSHGFRAREWSGNELGRPRVLVLGHSVAYAVGVDAEYSWTQVLENELRAQGLERAEVLNLAVPGYTLEQMLAVWDEVGRALAPDLVIAELSGYSVRPMVRTQEPVDFPLSRPIRRSALFDFYRRKLARVERDDAASERVLSDPHDVRNDPLWELAGERLEGLRAELASAGAQLVVLATPSMADVFDGAGEETRWGEWCAARPEVGFLSCTPALRAAMHELLGQLRARGIDPLMARGRLARLDPAELPAADTSCFFLDDLQHLTPRGHAVVAALVTAELLARLRPAGPPALDR